MILEDKVRKFKKRWKVPMCGGEPFKPDPFSLCLLKWSLDDLFSMVDVKELCGKVLGRRSGKNVFRIFEMKMQISVFQRKLLQCVFLFSFFFVQIDVVNFILI